MNIYQSSSKENFLDEVADFVIEKFSDDLSKLKVILPSGLLSNEFQRCLIEKLGTTLLPEIIHIGELVAESEEIFKIPSKEIGTLSKLEEKTVLAEIIHSYKELNYDLLQSLRLAPSLSHLFFELEAGDITLDDLQKTSTLDQSEHWNKIFDFLEYAFENWQKKINMLSKITKASYQQLMFDTELHRLKSNPKEFLLIAGIIDPSKMIHKFIKGSLEISNSYVILPPKGKPEVNTKQSTEDALYGLYKLMELLEITDKEIQKINLPKSNILDQLITKHEIGSDDKNLKHDIKYREFENIFHEAEYIAKKCAHEISNNQNLKIAILSHDQSAKDQYCAFLDKYDLKYHDLFGNDILKEPLISLILIVSDILFSDFNLKNFFSFLSHPIINSEQSQIIKNLIRKHNRLAASFESITNLIQNHADDETKKYFLLLNNSLPRNIKAYSFSNFLYSTLESIEKLLPNIWNQNPTIAKSLLQINKINWQIQITNNSDFPELLQQLLYGGRGPTPKSESNITICKPQESSLINYDIVIITDLNEGSYPLFTHNTPWLNAQMQKDLGLDSNKFLLGMSLYNFYLNLQNKETLLTRSIRKDSSKQMLASPFLLHLKHILVDKLHSQKAKALLDKYEENNSSEIEYAESVFFPKQISATDIETLIRTPYNFYAKKILNLRKIDEIDDKPSLAEFGNFFHLVVEQYTKSYKKDNFAKEETLTEIAKHILLETNIPGYSKKSWATKLDAISKEFIEFDESRRENARHIYSEIKGKMNFHINGMDLSVIAIADRIEVTKNGASIICDYKTGAIPSKKDVLSGMSPQLMIEAILLSEGGFDIDSQTTLKLVYIKINSNAPYIKTTEIEITQDDIINHKKGLISLLEHYIKTKQFPIEPNLMKYDDYKHLARRGA